MITIVALFCQLVFLPVHCAPKKSQDPQIENWLLREAHIKYESTREPAEHYTRKVRLVRYNNGFCVDTLINGDDEVRKVVACFKVDELYAFMDNELYAITENPYRAIRMSIAKKKEIPRLTKFLVPTTPEHVSF